MADKFDSLYEQFKENVPQLFTAIDEIGSLHKQILDESEEAKSKLIKLRHSNTERNAYKKMCKSLRKTHMLYVYNVAPAFKFGKYLFVLYPYLVLFLYLLVSAFLSDNNYGEILEVLLLAVPLMIIMPLIFYYIEIATVKKYPDGLVLPMYTADGRRMQKELDKIVKDNNALFAQTEKQIKYLLKKGAVRLSEEEYHRLEEIQSVTYYSKKLTLKGLFGKLKADVRAESKIDSGQAFALLGIVAFACVFFAASVATPQEYVVTWSDGSKTREYY